jgi:PhzF family phenazine biosynthesis protein
MHAPVGFPLFHVDAFTDRAFHGNPAAVCLLDAAGAEDWMQLAGAEMNLAETAFVSPREGGYDLRWFTPTCEVDLCGHATLASAHVLWETGRLAPGDIARFHTRSGWLTAAQRDGLIELDFPATPADPAPAFAGSLAEAVRAPVEWAGRSRFDLVARLANADAVRRANPDFARVAVLPCRGVIVTAAGDDGEHDFVSRFFGPQSGIDEDPVTGSAHCALAPYWAGVLGRDTLVGYQASPRGGTVRMQLEGNRVRLGGHAVTILRGELLT